MPARYRTIGPHESQQLAKALLEAREAREWTRPQLSREMASHGDEMSAATIMHIEGGVWDKEGNHPRLVSLDEAAAFCRALGAEFAVKVVAIIGGANADA